MVFLEGIIMKKLLALTLALVIVLSLGSAAFAASSPVKGKTDIEDMPGDTTGYVPKQGAEIIVIPNAELNDEEKVIVDKALETVQNDGYLPVESFLVIADEEGFIIVEAPEDAVIFVVYDNGYIQKNPVKELEYVGNSRYKVPVSAGVASVIVALAK